MREESGGTRWLHRILSALSVTTILAAWYILSLQNPTLIPTPAQTLGQMCRMLFRPETKVTLLDHVFASLGRVLIAYALATVVGVGLGLLFGCSRRFHNYVGPVFELLRPIPPIAWIPLVVMWCGIGETSKIVIVFIGALVPIVVNTYSGIAQIDPVYEKVGRTLGASPKEMLYEILLPAGFPHILAGMRTALSVGWMCVIAAEMIAAKRGLGYLIVRSMESGNMGNILISLIFIGGISALLSWGFSKLEAIICPW